MLKKLWFRILDPISDLFWLVLDLQSHKAQISEQIWLIYIVWPRFQCLYLHLFALEELQIYSGTNFGTSQIGFPTTHHFKMPSQFLIVHIIQVCFIFPCSQYMFLARQSHFASRKGGLPKFKKFIFHFFINLDNFDQSV